MDAKPPARTSLLGLPPELRLRIYYYVFALVESPVFCSSDRHAVSRIFKPSDFFTLEPSSHKQDHGTGERRRKAGERSQVAATVIGPSKTAILVANTLIHREAVCVLYGLMQPLIRPLQSCKRTIEYLDSMIQATIAIVPANARAYIRTAQAMIPYWIVYSSIDKVIEEVKGVNPSSQRTAVSHYMLLICTRLESAFPKLQSLYIHVDHGAFARPLRSHTEYDALLPFAERWTLVIDLHLSEDQNIAIEWLQETEPSAQGLVEYLKNSAAKMGKKFDVREARRG